MAGRPQGKKFIFVKIIEKDWSSAKMRFLAVE
jgi:hypothetical protein